MSKYVKVVITEIDEETGKSEEIANEELEGFTLLGSCRDGKRMCEMLVHETIGDLASKLANAKKASFACKLANIIMQERSNSMGDIENSLFASIMGNMSEGGVQ